MENMGSDNKKRDASEPLDDSNFKTWKEGLNKELLTFWKSMIEQYQE